MEAKKKMCTRVVFAVLPGLLLLVAGCGMGASFPFGQKQGEETSRPSVGGRERRRPLPLVGGRERRRPLPLVGGRVQGIR